MTDPRRTLRRPALAPLLVPLLAVVVAGAGIVWLSTWARTTVVVLVRHAEPSTATGGDPDLSPAGERRAAQLGKFLAEVLEGQVVDDLYAADTRRAQQTAAAVANQFKLPVNLLAGSDWSGLGSRIRRDHRGETVLVVGYANTLPAVVTQLAGSHVALEEDDFSSVFVVLLPSPGQARVLRLQYGALPTTDAAGTAKGRRSRR
jgi:phosphohistidine phosphatase SixA